MNKKAYHCFVTGRVQGVFFRVTTKEKAESLGLTGWVKNLPDSKVELVACGKENKLQDLIKWLKIGPELAKVEKLDYEEIELNEEYKDFSVW